MSKFLFQLDGLCAYGSVSSPLKCAVHVQSGGLEEVLCAVHARRLKMWHANVHDSDTAASQQGVFEQCSVLSRGHWTPGGPVI